jgi:UDP-hydrolysing UDP-N-acetyl-D-glucosamine 2-epimerase
MRKIAVYVGSRANYSSAKSIMRHIQKHQELELFIVLSAAAVLPRYGNIKGLMQKDGFEPNIITNTLVEGETPAAMSKSIGLGMIDYSTSLEILSPDCVIAIGDRFDVLPWVIASAMMNIPIAHTMGGERTGTIDESIRHAISKFANIHFPANLDSANRLIRMGENPNLIYTVGCPRNDYVLECLNKINNGDITSSAEIFSRYKGVGEVFDLDSEDFLLVLFHPVTTEFGSNKEHIKELLSALDSIRMKTIMIWPNADAGSDEISKEIRIFRERGNSDWLHLFVNLPIDIYVQLMHKCACMIGNSSSAIREGELIGVPAVNIGSRQNMRLKGKNIIDVDTNSNDIVSAIRKQIKNGHYESEFLYGNGNAGEKIANIISDAHLLTTQKINLY